MSHMGYGTLGTYTKKLLNIKTFFIHESQGIGTWCTFNDLNNYLLLRDILTKSQNWTFHTLKKYIYILFRHSLTVSQLDYTIHMYVTIKYFIHFYGY